MKILITVKTYPVSSSKHTETVCTAGISEHGKWVRIYPIPYRTMDKVERFSKFQWVEADIVRDTRDPRQESHRLAGGIVPLQKMGTTDAWRNRKSIVLSHVYTNLTTLINEARNVAVFTSLATFKPAKIIRFHIEKNKRHSDKAQLELLPLKQRVERVPYNFYYSFIDEEGKRSHLQILDWEIYQLCRKLIRKYGQKIDVIYQHLNAKYFEEFVSTRDIYFFLGTNKQWHIRRAKNPFMIVGVFYPPKDE
jgi:hypothetical protein